MAAPVRSQRATPAQSRTQSRSGSPTGNNFPRIAGSVLRVNKRDNGLISPAQPAFSFHDEESTRDQPIDSSTMPTSFDRKHIDRAIERDTPGGGSMIKRNQSSKDGSEAGRRRSQFYGEVFAYREPNLSTKERIYRNSMITAQVKTNVIIKDEYLFLSDLSAFLSHRYQRPQASISIVLDHSACLLFAGSFESAYIINITALPSQIQATTNKRNAALVQNFLQDSLGVTPSRGVIRFVPVADENLATNGTTILGEVETHSRHSSENQNHINGRSQEGTSYLGRNKSRRAPKPQELQLNSTRSRSGSRANTSYNPPPTNTSTAPSSPTSNFSALKSPSLPAIPMGKSVADRRAEKMQRVGRRRSILAMFGRKGH